VKIYDISVSISNDMITWPGDPSVKISRDCSISEGSSCNVSSIQMGAHTGTHIDSPNHFIDEKYTTDCIKLEDLIGKCIVIEVNGNDITVDDLKQVNLDIYSRVLIKTKNSDLWLEQEFNKDFIALNDDVLDYLIYKNIKLIGVDYLSIESFYSNGDIHRKILENEIIILEGLNLREIFPNEYTLICLPLKISNVDGAPSRVVLVDNGFKGK